jgi:hypothetical protein
MCGSLLPCARRYKCYRVLIAPLFEAMPEVTGPMQHALLPLSERATLPPLPRCRTTPSSAHPPLFPHVQLAGALDILESAATVELASPPSQPSTVYPSCAGEDHPCTTPSPRHLHTRAVVARSRAAVSKAATGHGPAPLRARRASAPDRWAGRSQPVWLWPTHRCKRTERRYGASRPTPDLTRWRLISFLFSDIFKSATSSKFCANLV